MNKYKLQELLNKELTESKDTVLSSLVSLLIEQCSKQTTVPMGIALAASFDLLVGVFYYQKVPNRGWLLCSHGAEHYYFPFVNVCPRCAIEREPAYHKAGKGQSANIGTATIKALILFIQEWCFHTNNHLKVFKGEEPVDLCVFDERNETLLLAEVKSAPLITLPLVIVPEDASSESNLHENLTMPTFKGANMGVLMPTFNGNVWQAVNWQFIRPFDNSDTFYVEMLFDLVKRDGFFDTYLGSWQAAFTAYAVKKKSDAIFWLTNGCGVPSPVPEYWPDRVGSGRETISDGKTSVGLDRTDDIKKGVYQLLKLRMTPITGDYTVKVGIVSNTHAARHHEEYIQPIANVMWLESGINDAVKAGDLPTETPIYNLFDGIITFTETFTKDSWIKHNFNFNG